MLDMDFARSRVGRSGETWTRGDARPPAKARMRMVVEIGATLSILVLIMISAVAVRALLSLPHVGL
jgi:hypothetical protein